TTCPNCGALVEISGATHATECPFCATPVVLDTGTTRHIKPQALIPFALTEAEARKAMVAWMGSLWFAPNTLLEYARKGRAMNGVYVPFWTFDADTASRYTGQRGEYYYETRTVQVRVNGRMETRQEQVRHTRWYPASGRVERDFDDVLIMASRSLPGQLGDELTPWDLGALVPYGPEYLAGFQAEGYTVGLADGHQVARERMSAVILQDVRRDIGGDEQRVDDVDTNWSDETFKHILLPIWTAAYKYNGKSYRFLVNGQTGEVQGERPWSVWKIAFAVLLALIVAFGAAYLYDPEAMGFDQPDWMD
ncbi:MAG TPA: primosomal protein N' (replication factor Y) - superfamily II helicase, partial [Tabrizicola sp.]|nr:primosomal protein N' (replication factor Y) - superfamily II helicase [Tabrizicola sp.]